MTIPLDKPTAKGPPAVAFNSVGAHVVVGIANVGEYHQSDFDTGAKEYWDDGGPKMGKVVTGLVVSTGGDVTAGRDRLDVNPGDSVSFFCEGSKFYTYRDAVAEAGGIDVGDVMRWARIEDQPPKRAGMNAAKMYEAKIRKPEARDGDLVARCTAIWQAAQDRPTLDHGSDPFPSHTPEPEFIFDNEPEF